MRIGYWNGYDKLENSLAQTQLFSAKSEALLCWVDESLQEVKLQAYLERAVVIGIPVDDLADPDPRPVKAMKKSFRRQ